MHGNVAGTEVALVDVTPTPPQVSSIVCLSVCLSADYRTVFASSFAHIAVMVDRALKTVISLWRAEMSECFWHKYVHRYKAPTKCRPLWGVCRVATTAPVLPFIDVYTLYSRTEDEEGDKK